MIDAIKRQAQELSYYHAYVGHGTEASITLSKMVLDRAPDHMSKVYFGLSGSNANETNIKLVWYYNNILARPNKKKSSRASRDPHILFGPKDAIAAKVTPAMLRHGVIARAMPHSDITGFTPPFTLSEAEADIIVDATAKAIEEVL